MKKWLIFFLCIIYVGFCYGQHIQFLGIPLGGDISIFKQKLIDKGYEYSSQYSDVGGYTGAYVFFGRFSGEFAIVAVHYTPKSKLVARVEVQYSGYSKWPYQTNTRKDQEEIFDDRKHAISIKYGNPSVVKTSEKYHRFAKWNLRDGKIVLFIERMKGDPNIWGMYVVYDDDSTVQKYYSETDDDF